MKMVIVMLMCCVLVLTFSVTSTRGEFDGQEIRGEIAAGNSADEEGDAETATERKRAYHHNNNNNNNNGFGGTNNNNNNNNKRFQRADSLGILGRYTGNKLAERGCPKVCHGICCARSDCDCAITHNGPGCECRVQ